MTRSKERQQSPEPSGEASGAAVASTSHVPSPTRSDRSSDSEGKPVREKLKETRIDAQTASDTSRPSDQRMHDAPNGADNAASSEQSTSGSESGRGRLRRKRSREEFEEEDEKNTPAGKKERHARKKSRDVTSPKPAEADAIVQPLKSSVSRIDEHDRDEKMTGTEKALKPQHAASNGLATPPAIASDREESTISPKNKRTREQASSGETAGLDEKVLDSKEAQMDDKSHDEPKSKRPREKDDLLSSTDTKIPPGSGFANSSVKSPFASLSPKPESTTAKKATAEDPPQTSDDKLKSSGFGSFAASSASPFGAVGASSSKSPFAAASGGPKLSGFASPAKSTSPAPSGFGALGSSSSRPALGGSALGGAAPGVTAGSLFGSSLGQSAFGGLSGSKSGLSSFATPGSSAISGLSSKPARAFGAAATGGKDESDEEDQEEGDDDDQASENGETGKSKQEQEKRSNFVPIEVETGEEGEETEFSARGKLYLFNDKTWQERGIGGLKLNVTKESPKKARLILRADGTHRLLLNAPITKELQFGDRDGKIPEDGKILFTAPTASGAIETLLLKMKAERGTELCNKVHKLKAEML